MTVTKASETEAAKIATRVNGKPDKFELTLSERIGILTVLPQSGNIITGRIVRDLRQELSPTEQEIREANIESHPNGGISWSVKATTITKVVPIGETGLDIIVKGFELASEKESLDFTWLALYERLKGPEGDTAKEG